jgi:hypothetical protein
MVYLRYDLLTFIILCSIWHWMIYFTYSSQQSELHNMTSLFGELHNMTSLFGELHNYYTTKHKLSCWRSIKCSGVLWVSLQQRRHWMTHFTSCKIHFGVIFRHRKSVIDLASPFWGHYVIKYFRFDQGFKSFFRFDHRSKSFFRIQFGRQKFF